MLHSTPRYWTRDALYSVWGAGIYDVRSTMGLRQTLSTDRVPTRHGHWRPQRQRTLRALYQANQRSCMLVGIEPGAQRRGKRSRLIRAAHVCGVEGIGRPRWFCPTAGGSQGAARVSYGFHSVAVPGISYAPLPCICESWRARRVYE